MNHRRLFIVTPINRNIMRKISTYMASAAIVLGATVLTGCSDSPKFIGSWTSLAPDDITDELPAAATATSLMSLQFNESAENERGGSVVMSSILEITQPVQGSASAVDQAYEVSVAATTSVAGTWTYKDNDKDDLLLTFDMSSLDVKVDRNGVSFTQNMLTEQQQPQIDSLTEVTANLWKRQIATAMRKNLKNFTVLDDVKVNRDNILSFEIEVNNHDKDIHMRKNM